MLLCSSCKKFLHPGKFFIRFKILVMLGRGFGFCLVLANLLTTASYTIVYKIAQDTYTNKNSTWLLNFSNVMEYGVTSCVWILYALYCRYKPLTEGSVRDWKKESGLICSWAVFRQMLVIALCCSCATFIWAVSGPSTPADVQSLLNTLLVPYTFLLSMWLLKKRYNWYCKISAILVVIGTLLGTLTPADAEQKPCYLCYVMFGLAQFPYAYQYIVTERAFCSGIGLFFLEIYSGWIEVLLTFCFSPLQGWILGLLGETQEEYSWKNGWSCFLGQNECGNEAFWWAMALVFASVTNDIAYLMLTKFGSATFMSVADGFSIPVVNIFMSARFLGRYREASSSLNLVGALICLLGMVFWGKGERQDVLQPSIEIEENLLNSDQFSLTSES